MLSVILMALLALLIVENWRETWAWSNVAKYQPALAHPESIKPNTAATFLHSR